MDQTTFIALMVGGVTTLTLFIHTWWELSKLGDEVKYSLKEKFQYQLDNIRDEINREEKWLKHKRGIKQRIKCLEVENKRLHALLAECIDHVYGDEK